MSWSERKKMDGKKKEDRGKEDGQKEEDRGKEEKMDRKKTIRRIKKNEDGKKKRREKIEEKLSFDLCILRNT